MKVKFYGAAGEVGRSCIMIESNDTRVLLDCGIKLGREEIPNEYPQIEDSELRKVDAIILSHTHLDHIGYLPHVFGKGWNGFVYATKPTLEIVELLLSDYVRISAPKGVSKKTLGTLKKHFRMVKYGKEFRVKGLRFKLNTAGHVLGSSTVEVTDGRHRLIYTGDMAMRKTRLLEPVHSSNLNADTLIIETTNGGEADDFQRQRADITRVLPMSIKETINQGGKVIVPALAVSGGESLLMIDDLMRSGVIPKVPIYVDGMITKTIQIHRNNLGFCRIELQNRVNNNKDDPFKSKNFHMVKSRQVRQRSCRSMSHA